MMARLIALLAFACIAYAQILIPAGKLGFSVSKENGATVFRGNDLELAYVEGIGWSLPLVENLPPPQEDRIPLEVVRALNLFGVDEAGVRISSDAQKMRIVLDLPLSPEESGWVAPVIEPTPYDGRLQLNLPYFVPGLENLAPPPGIGMFGQYSYQGTTLSIQAPAGRIYRYRTLVLPDPPRYMVDVYYLNPEKTESLGGGFTYREAWAWTPEPVRLYLLEALPGSWRMESVGRPGERQVLGKMAPGALAVLNGGYFDTKTSTPIGLWVKDGIALNFAYGRSALFWQESLIFAGIPKLETTVQLADGRRLRVGLNLNRAKYTVYTLPGTVGRLGENLFLVQGDRIVGTYPAPFEMLPGFWALSFPAEETPVARTGEILKLYGSLDPPMAQALEAGPLLIQAGANVFDPNGEPFRDKSPLLATAAQSAVAWTQEGKLWLVVSDPTRPEVLAKVLLERGAWGAIRMDGGGSAQLWVKGQLRNPSENGVRPVVNGLAVYPLK